MSEETNQSEEIGNLLKFRREKMDRLREMGVDPFGTKFETTDSPHHLREKLRGGETGKNRRPDHRAS